MTLQKMQIKGLYSIDFKITVITFAENISNRNAKKHLCVDESIIRRRRRNKEEFLKIPNKSCKTVFKRQCKPKWVALEMHLKSWILKQRQKRFQVSGASALIEGRNMQF